MKIGVDAGCLATQNQNQKTGVYRLALNCLQQLTQQDSQNQYFLYSFLPIPQSTLKNFGKTVTNVITRPKLGWQHFALPLQLLKDRPDVFLGLSQALPIFCPCPSLVIFHDLGFEYWPQFYPARLRRLSRRSARESTKILAVSHATKKDLVRIYKRPKSQIKISYEGCNRQVFKPKAGKKEKYFLFVGSSKPSKNLANVIRAFNKLPTDFKLIIVGQERPLNSKIKNIRFLGYVNEKKLVQLYQKAIALVSPAYYEGFGLPLLEAMACGCPVICGDSGSQPEVVGQAGILVKPDKPQSIYQAMNQVIKPKINQKMIRQGIWQSKKFSWANFGQDVWQTLNEISH